MRCHTVAFLNGISEYSLKFLWIQEMSLSFEIVDGLLTSEKL